MKLCCGLKVGTKKFKYIGKDKIFYYYNCPKCKSTRTIRIQEERKNEKTNTIPSSNLCR